MILNVAWLAEQRPRDAAGVHGPGLNQTINLPVVYNDGIDKPQPYNS